MTFTCTDELKVVVLYVWTYFLACSVAAEYDGTITYCKGPPTIQKENCTYPCRLLQNSQIWPLYCMEDRKTLITCDDYGQCRIGICQTATCECNNPRRCSGCLGKIVLRICSKFDNTTSSTSTTSSPIWRNIPQYEKTSTGFSWKTFGIIVGVLLVVMVVLLVVEKFSGVHLRDFIRETSTHTQPTFSMREPSAPPQSTIIAFHTLHEIPVPEQQVQPQQLPDLPPSYATAVNITDPPPAYDEVSHKSLEKR